MVQVFFDRSHFYLMTNQGTGPTMWNCSFIVGRPISLLTFLMFHSRIGYYLSPESSNLVVSHTVDTTVGRFTSCISYFMSLYIMSGLQ